LLAKPQSRDTQGQSVALSTYSPQVIVIKHEEFTEEVPVSNWILSGNRAEKQFNSLLERTKNCFN